MKKNIAIIVQKLYGGGAERAAANLSIMLSKNYNVHLIVFDGKKIAYTYGGILYDLNLPASKGKLRKIIRLLKRAKVVKKIKKKHNISCSISLMDGANIVNVLSKYNDKVLTSIRICMSVARRSKNNKLRIVDRIMLNYLQKKSYKIVAVSNDVRKDLIYKYKLKYEKVIAISNQCDINNIMCNRNKLNNNNEKLEYPTVVTMGRLTVQKGQWHLIRSFSKVLKYYPNARLYILGEGPLKEKLKLLCMELNILDRVIFKGFVESPHNYILQCTTFVLPSLFEGMSNVLLETLACGAPCIATDCHSGTREVLAPGTEILGKLDKIELAKYGILISVPDKMKFNANEPLDKAENQMKEAMLLMFKQNDLRKNYKKMSKERSTDYLPDKIFSKWKELIEKN